MLVDVGEERAEAGATPSTVRQRGLLERLPDLVGPAVAGFALPAMLLLLAGFFVVPLVILLGVISAVVVAVMAARGDREAAAPHDRLATLAALALALAFFVINSLFAAQNIYATRDPATYSLAGQWLVHHHSILIPTHGDVFGSATGITADSAGFRTDLADPSVVDAQGNHLLPALLGVVGWLAGPAGLFRTNSLLGALALLAVFSMARRLVGRSVALVAMAALAVSMPMAAFSRDTYTEPVTLLLLFGGASVLWRAVETRRGSQFLAAGLTVGASAMARVDGYGALLPLVVTAVALLVLAAPGQRRGWLARAGLFLGGMVVSAGIGYLDVSRLSADYYHDLRSQVLALIGAGFALAVVGAVIVLLAWTTPAARWVLAEHRRRTYAWVCAGGVLALFAVLASRPFWMVDHGTCSGNISALQHGLGLPVDPCRTYYEHTVSWIAWYYGWPMVLLAVVGLALLVRRTILHGDLRLLGLVGMVLALSALYLVNASIYPDQIWAMRRFLPVVIPGLLVSAGYVLYVLASQGQWYRYVAAGLGLVLIGSAAYVSYPVERVRTGVPQLAQVRAVCQALPDDAAVLSLGRSVIGTYAQTMRSFCDVPSYVMQNPAAAALADARASAERHGRTLYVIAEKADGVPFVTGVVTPEPFFVAHVTKLPERLVDVPAGPNAYDVPLFLGIVGSDGRVTPIHPST